MHITENQAHVFQSPSSRGRWEMRENEPDDNQIVAISLQQSDGLGGQLPSVLMCYRANTIRYDTIEEINVDSKAEYTA